MWIKTVTDRYVYCQFGWGNNEKGKNQHSLLKSD